MYQRIFLCLLNVALIQSRLLHLTCAQIKQLVDGHNSKRLLLAKGAVRNQPTATNMKAMVWDEEIAKKAESWAKKKKFAHNPDTNLRSARFKTGENLYLYRTTDKKYRLNFDKALQSWFAEHENFNYKQLEFKDFQGSKMIGHYTQMVWAETTYIGCAVSQYEDGMWNSFLLVCNYAPKGNTIKRPPYEIKGLRKGSLSCSVPECTRKYGNRCSK